MMLALSLRLSLEFDLYCDCTSETELCSVIEGISSVNLCFSFISKIFASKVPSWTYCVSFFGYCSLKSSLESQFLVFCCLRLISLWKTCGWSRGKNICLLLSNFSPIVEILLILVFESGTSTRRVCLTRLFSTKLSSLRDTINFLLYGSFYGVTLILSLWSCKPLASFLS